MVRNLCGAALTLGRLRIDRRGDSPLPALDEADRMQIVSMLELTPLQRLRTLRGFVDGVQGLRRARRIRSG